MSPFLCFYFWQSLAFIVVPYKGFSIPETRKFWLVQLGIQEFLAWNAGILQFGIRNTAKGNRNPANDWNPESNFQ